MTVCGFDEGGVDELDRAGRTEKGGSSQKLGLGVAACERGQDVERRREERKDREEWWG